MYLTFFSFKFREGFEPRRGGRHHRPLRGPPHAHRPSLTPSFVMDCTIVPMICIIDLVHSSSKFDGYEMYNN
ncbi:hypothetical protein EUGRSUZ_G02734 [Eucalyptus grandis]|uniref:Uncharacterized protein n=2 Tax=Eucalyptus grandis TaxID=71139 RepID=A0ACC3K9M9_EUCGR|nr:hypothetical protein EUGRSUZ_G02734 [Eucalyptus grandis]